ncbi:hypothetical protein SAMN06296429_10125 [Janibacter indicus]|uniref:Uncharacterized protein n=1 Tax=Janibacter indicus TaxID=857417 RepID=A0A1W1Y510_9MICO|nr:hypothetical protein SAMN06296429_10125 [Janibacter indicus]
MGLVKKITIMLASATMAFSLAGLLGFRAASYDWAGVTEPSWDWALPEAGTASDLD